MNEYMSTRARESVRRGTRPAAEPNEWPSMLRQQAENWAACGLSPDLLLRGVALDQARRWARAREDDLSGIERDLIEDSESAQRERERSERLRVGVRLIAMLIALLSAVALNWFVQARLEAGRAAAAREEALALAAQAEQVRGAAEAAATLVEERIVTQQREMTAMRADRDQAHDLAWEQRQRALIAWSRACRSGDPGLSILLALEAADISHRGRLDPNSRRRGIQELVDAVAESGITIAIGPSTALPRAGTTTAAWHAGTLLVARPDGGAILWDMTRGVVLDRVSASHGVISSANWDPDGRAVTLMREDGFSLVWDLEAGRAREGRESQPDPTPTLLWEDDSELPSSGGLSAQPSAVAISPGDDSTLHVLDWPTLKAICCARAGRTMTPEEWTTYMGEDSSYRRTCPEFSMDSP
jgi:hypothetical protein